MILHVALPNGGWGGVGGGGVEGAEEVAVGVVWGVGSGRKGCFVGGRREAKVLGTRVFISACRNEFFCGSIVSTNYLHV